MFAGIVTDIGKVVAVTEGDGVRHVAIECGYDAATLNVGASVACAGICLTVAARTARAGGGVVFKVDAGPETLRLTNAGSWQAGTRLNLERSLSIGEEIGGHLVSGHIDGLAEIAGREDLGEAARFTFEAPPHLARFIATKGSIALDGTSLTVNNVTGSRFDCVLIPHTLKATTWGERRVGDRVHLEVDQIARYVARLAEAG